MEYQPVKVVIKHLGDERYEAHIYAGRSKKPIHVRSWEYEEKAGIDPTLAESGTLELRIPKDRVKIIMSASAPST